MVRTHEKRGVQEKRQGLRERFDLRVNCLECAEEVGFQRRPEKVGGEMVFYVTSSALLIRAFETNYCTCGR